MGINYWQLDTDSKWIDCLKQILCDESHHRDVNHGLAKLFKKDKTHRNPYVKEHIENFERNARRVLDKTDHRDVNHDLAKLLKKDKTPRNPYVEEHIENFE